MSSITPCLWFDDQGEQAAEFYTSIFPNSKITNIARFGPGGPRPEGTVMTVQFELDGREYVALNGGPAFTFTEAISLQVFCGSQAEVDEYWARLTDGGQESQCGWLKDRYGLSWQIVPTALGELLGDPDLDRARRATEAMLRMKKIDVAELRRAADGT
ncbi:VOC family protein [Frankia gtarii]|uniref:VOC family protein n=1 Tax=Frankia gtarii TaxID=2950102 RepID=UPI0021BF67C2|nr:VOC family protein [Frankia gtarii]